MARIQVEGEGEQRAKEVDVLLTTTHSCKKARAERGGRKAFSMFVQETILRFLQQNEPVQGITMLTHCMIL